MKQKGGLTFSFRNQRALSYLEIQLVLTRASLNIRLIAYSTVVTSQKPLSSNYNLASMTSGSPAINRPLLRVVTHHPAHPKILYWNKKSPTSLNLTASNGESQLEPQSRILFPCQQDAINVFRRRYLCLRLLNTWSFFFVLKGLP